MLAIHSDGYAQRIIDALTAEDRGYRFNDDRVAWYDCFSDLWNALKHGAKINVQSLGLSRVAVHQMYGAGPAWEMRPTKHIASGNPDHSALIYAIMCEDAGSNGAGPYVMVCYSDRTGDELDRIIL